MCHDTCACRIITYLPRDIDIYFKKLLGHIYFFKIARVYSFAHFCCMYNLNVISSTQNHCCFIWIEFPSPYPKKRPTINHFLGYCVVFHQRIRYIRSSHAGYVFAKVRWRRDTCTYNFPSYKLTHFRTQCRSIFWLWEATLYI